ncbi:MAG: heme-copper oxidase subunit III [Planctomycetota bacterium]|nr:heme-copper oxidase subunit III [Planctomycetota bacterium]
MSTAALPSGLAATATPPPKAVPHYAPVTPGKVAMWLFLATEIMFFTGLIGSYIVLRAGSPALAYSHEYAPATDLSGVDPATIHAFNWPKPYDHATNPLSIDLTALNTFFLICSSVTMYLALLSAQKGDKGKIKLFLFATFLIGSLFLSIQVYEYFELIEGRSFPVGISATGHFRPSVSLFASCFFTMTGFHGMHVFGGVVSIFTLFIGSLLGKFTAEKHAPIEMIGLYWHFVDLVWIILFTIVYLV